MPQNTARLPHAEVVRIKERALELFDTLAAENLSQVAQLLRVSPTKLYEWRKKDPEWAEALKFVDELIADRLESEIVRCKTVPEVTSRIFRLKALRPEKYRDSFKVHTIDNKLIELLIELRKLGGANDKTLPNRSLVALPDASNSEDKILVEPNDEIVQEFVPVP